MNPGRDLAVRLREAVWDALDVEARDFVDELIEVGEEGVAIDICLHAAIRAHSVLDAAVIEDVDRLGWQDEAAKLREQVAA